MPKKINEKKIASSEILALVSKYLLESPHKKSKYLVKGTKTYTFYTYRQFHQS